MKIAYSLPVAALGAIAMLGACIDDAVAPPGDVHSALAAQPLFSHSASENTGTFDWFFGTDFPFFTVGPAVSFAGDGSRIEISGKGSFSIGEGRKSVSGGGTYEIFDSSDNPVASGNWTMTHVRGYVDYGGAPANPALRGGTVEAEIQLDGLGKGSLWIFCLISTPPPPSKSEGVHVRIGRWQFDDVQFSPTIFIRG